MGLIERLVKPFKRREHLARYSCNLRPVNAECQRKQDEAGNGNDLYAEQAPGERVDFGPGQAQEQRSAVEQVNRPIGYDAPGQEWNILFPRVYDGANIGMCRSNRGGDAVAEEKERYQAGEPLPAAS